MLIFSFRHKSGFRLFQLVPLGEKRTTGQEVIGDCHETIIKRYLFTTFMDTATFKLPLPRRSPGTPSTVLRNRSITVWKDTSKRYSDCKPHHSDYSRLIQLSSNSFSLPIFVTLGTIQIVVWTVITMSLLTVSMLHKERPGKLSF